MTAKFISIVILFVSLIFACQEATAQTAQWRPVGGSRHENISGMALIEHSGGKTTFLAVHDNKKKEQTHAAILTIEGAGAPIYTPLEWLGNDIPTDLEAVSAVPGFPGNFMALTAAGRAFHIKLNRAAKTVVVVKSFDVPQIPAGSDFEGFSVQKIGDSILAVWAERGLAAKPATLFWGKLDLQTYAFSQVGSALVKVPCPAGQVRHVSDVKVDSTGAIFISSASDPGNDGPFASAVYFLGVFNSGDRERISFTQTSSLTRLFHFDYHKVEAIEFVPGADGGMAFGTDDENLGAAIYLDW